MGIATEEQARSALRLSDNSLAFAIDMLLGAPSAPPAPPLAAQVATPVTTPASDLVPTDTGLVPPATAAPAVVDVPPVVSSVASPAFVSGRIRKRVGSVEFIEDETVPDGSTVLPGKFLKTWCVRNNGDDTWAPDARVVLLGENTLSGPTVIDLPELSPGQKTRINVWLVAPELPGCYRAQWRFQDAAGNVFANHYRIWVDIVVGEVRPRPQAEFVVDVTLPDGSFTCVQRGQVITKTWRVRNCGDHPWPAGCHLVCTEVPSVCVKTLPAVAAGDTTDISLDLSLDEFSVIPGRFRRRLEWHLHDEHGNPFEGHWRLWLDITIEEAASTSLPTSTLVSVKLQDTRDGSFRRFSLSSLSIAELRAKALGAAPACQARRLSFVDSDGDACVLSSDMELAEAYR
eukprot:CAMPEP_0114572854 /NCGR_PEP_ID=MMETSP0114-20121206/18531_1 /TAXON_ID=31324 /ORGANISM="Goniomonas sp, Strain m" /LENGTH=400 /DNA_ID=CAMNT_0001760127 /DNA_START=1 /DNA_END=1199 /DNA_ORIENTATION=+